MALQKTVPQYQLEELSGEEDVTLSRETHEPMNYTYVVPPGVSNLQEWGKLTFQTGKYKGHLFSEIFEKETWYVQMILSNTRLKSVDMLSFQNFCKARKKKLAQNMIQGPILPKTHARRHAAMSSGPIPDHQHQGQAKGSESEWSHVEVEPTLNPKEKQKRGYAQTKSSQPMAVEGDEQKINELQTQIAILQRELAKQQPSTDQPNTP